MNDKNRPRVNVLLQSPCRNCEKRAKPKTCESTCILWEEYKQKKDLFQKNNEIKKEVDMLFALKFNKRGK